MTGVRAAPIPDRPEALRVLPGGAVVAGRSPAEAPLSSPSFLSTSTAAPGWATAATRRRSGASRSVCGPARRALASSGRAGRCACRPWRTPAPQLPSPAPPARSPRRPAADGRGGAPLVPGPPGRKDPGPSPPAPTLFLPPTSTSRWSARCPTSIPTSSPIPPWRAAGATAPSSRGSTAPAGRATGPLPRRRAAASPRNPNDWFYAHGGRAPTRPPGRILARMLDRLRAPRSSAAPLSTWSSSAASSTSGPATSACSTGVASAAFVEPNIVTGVGEAEYHSTWQEMALPGKPEGRAHPPLPPRPRAPHA